MTISKESIKRTAEQDFVAFVKLIAPYLFIGEIHRELMEWWERQGHKSHQLVLLPRGHLKSTLIALRVVWRLTREPWLTFLYLSSSSNLAEKQLGLIKTILTSNIYRRYWPDMVHIEEGKRAKWSQSEIVLDHPSRKEEGIRDPSVFTAGLTTSITGMHCDVAVLDDIVVQENAYTEEGRAKVRGQYSLLSSIENAGAEEWVVGTHYAGSDLYKDMKDMEEEIYDEDGNIVSSSRVYEVFERKVEDAGDGTGEFLWPRTRRSDGKWFGFNTEILAKKRAQYLDKRQFYAQYYNDPTNPGELKIPPDKFQYYERSYIKRKEGIWYFKDTRLNLFAAIDFAYSLKKRADYTAIIVIGIDANRNVYVLDIDRFKTGNISEYFDHILRLHIKWGFRKIRAEVTAAQETIARELRNQYIKPQGLALSVEDFRPTRYSGSKEERIEAILEPRYANLSIWHYRGGLCSLLEEELMHDKPAHDDIKDVLASAVDMAIPPTRHSLPQAKQPLITNSRFGGVP